MTEEQIEIIMRLFTEHGCEVHAHVERIVRNGGHVGRYATPDGKKGELLNYLRSLVSTPVAKPLVKDSELLDWLEQHNGRFYNKDRISSIVGVGFLVAGDPNGVRHQTVRNAIRAAMAKELVDANVRDVVRPDGTVRHNVGSDNLSDEDRAEMDKQLSDWAGQLPAVCTTCGGNGMVGGLTPHSGYDAKPCPDCAEKYT